MRNSRRRPRDVSLERGPANFTLLTPLAFLPRPAAIHPDRTAVIYGERRISYREFHTRARRLASVPVAYGVGPGDTVSVVLPNVERKRASTIPGPSRSGTPWPKFSALFQTVNNIQSSFAADHPGRGILILDR